MSCESNPASSTGDSLCADKGESHHNQVHKNKDIKATEKLLWSGSMLSGYSFICRLTIVLVVILSWYYAYQTTDDTEHQEEMLQYKDEEEEVKDPWITWEEGFGEEKEEKDFGEEDEDDDGDPWIAWEGDFSEDEDDFGEEEDEENFGEEEDEEDDDDDDPWITWEKGFDYEKQRDFWIPDDDLPEDIAIDLQSDNEDVQEEAMIRRYLDPSKWDTFGYWDIYHYFTCGKLLLTSARPVWSEQQFRDTRDFYHEFVENDDTPFIGLFRSTYQANEDVYDLSQNAVPYLSGGAKGRGLKAARDIKEGDVIFKFTNNTIIFNDGNTMRKFLFAMNDRFSDPGMVCDIWIWAWIQDMEGEIPFAGVVDLNNGNLLNDYGLGALYGEEQEEIQEDSANIRCQGAALVCSASKDIAKGEELLGDYTDFVGSYSWANLFEGAIRESVMDPQV